MKKTKKKAETKPDEGFKGLLWIFVGYAVQFVFPIFIACLIATTSYSVLWSFVVAPALATLGYFYSKTHKE